MGELRAFSLRTLWILILGLVSHYPTVNATEPANVIYDHLERIRDDLEALHHITAPTWVDAPNMRGTSSILWSCLLTLFACVYTALHLNIPKRSGFVDILRSKLKWVLTALVAPEIVLWVASDQFFKALKLSKDLQAIREKELEKAGIMSQPSAPSFLTRAWRVLTCRSVNKASDDEEAKATVVQEITTEPGTEDVEPGSPVAELKPSTMTDTKMVSGQDENKAANDTTSEKEVTSASRPDEVPVPELEEEVFTPSNQTDSVFDLKYGFFVVMGGLEVINKDSGKVLTLNVDGVRWLANKNTALVRVRRSQILDRSKADTLQKGLVLFQVGWMALQCIGRKAYGLPLCLLELHTMVHVVCAILMYAFWLKKPLDLRSAELLNVNSKIVKELGRARYASGSDFDGDLFRTRGNMPDFEPAWLYKFDIEEMFDYVSESKSLTIVALVLPVLYGGIHLSAWNFEFPTRAEATIWRVACIIIASALPAIALLFLIGRGIYHRMPGGTMDDIIQGIFVVVLTLMFICMTVCRIFILVEALVSLRAVPLGVYWTPSWIQMIPHL